VEHELRKVATGNSENRIFPPSLFVRNRRSMMRDYLRWQTAFLQGFLRVISVAAHLLGLCCRQEVRLKFDIGRHPTLDVTLRISSQGILKGAGSVARQTKIIRKNRGLMILV